MKVNNYLKLIVLCFVFGLGFTATKAQNPTVDQKIEHNQQITNYDQWKQNQIQETQKGINDATFPSYTNEQTYAAQKAEWVANNPGKYEEAATGIAASTVDRIETGRGVKTYVINVNRGLTLGTGAQLTNKLQGQSGVVNVLVDHNSNQATVTLKDEYAETILRDVFNITL
jgi:hypothetical protein